MIENIIIELRNSDSKIMFLAKNGSNQELEYLDLFSKYVGALIQTGVRLKVVLGALYAKSQNFVNSNYNWKDYKSDLEKYEKSIQDYLTIGGNLNALFEKIR